MISKTAQSLLFRSRVLEVQNRELRLALRSRLLELLHNNPSARARRLERRVRALGSEDSVEAYLWLARLVFTLTTRPGLGI